MARVSIYLNFAGETEAAFSFYASVFGSPLMAVTRFGDLPDLGVPDPDRDKLMHVEVEILGGTVLMGTDVLESSGHTLVAGNNISLNLECSSLAQAQGLFDALAVQAREALPISPMPWGLNWGTLVDRFGIRWMFGAPLESASA